MKTRITRRSAITKLAGSAAVAGVASHLGARLSAAEEAGRLKGRINHSVCKWCYPKINLEDMCKAGKEMGLQSVELVKVSDFPTLQKHGLICAMVSGADEIGFGFNRLEHHDKLVKNYEEIAPKVAEAGFKHIIGFLGNRRGMSDEQGLENCAIGIKRILPICEKHNVLAVMELLNSKVDHKDYMCDHTKWGVELCKRVGSDRFKLLYDIYHMQIMEGDVIATIKKSHPYIAHYHTGGVPGRNAIDDTQESY